ncbi:Fc.00g036490.m01.CDS01 [Cosmosporella sp. VM-42]
MAPSSSMRPVVAPLVRRGVPTTLRKCILGTAGVQFPRSYASMPSMEKMRREMDKTARESAKRTDQETMSQMQRRANNEYFKSGGGPLFPGTFISLPISKYPRNPRAFLRYAWFRIKQYGIETLSVLNMKLKSMPDWTTRPKWKAAKGKIAPTAKVMYTEMLTAFAEGDKQTVQSLCLGNFAKKLTAAIDRRNPNERTVFEVVKFNKPLFYPRVVAHQVHQVNPYDKEMVTEQAVVAIASTQKASKYNATTGELIPGSTKVQEKIEHVVLSRQVSEKSFQADQWRIWGTAGVTTMEGYLKEQDWIRVEQAKRAGWEKPAQK